jgi:hypothetical protein
MSDPSKSNGDPNESSPSIGPDDLSPFVTELTDRDRDRFLALLNDTRIEPTHSLRKAAARYLERQRSEGER